MEKYNRLYDSPFDRIKNLNLHWIKINEEDGCPELFLDNHMLQTFRACEANFVESFINGYGSPNPVWFLSLGSAVHKMIELYYVHRKDEGFNLADFCTRTGYKIWHRLEMDKFSERKEYQTLGGVEGFIGLIIQYAATHRAENEHFRVVGTELHFGSNKEVPLLTSPSEVEGAPFRMYLSGKIDLLIDDGISICPMDHKTSKDFRGQNPLISYEIQEGMTGYVYAARKLLEAHNKQSNSSQENLNRRLANKIWMNFLQIKPEKNPTDRFCRAPLYKTDQQLEDYRLRQIRTGSKIFSLVTQATDVTKIVPDYNTMMCNNWMHGQCGFFPLHRLDSSTHENNAKTIFTKLPIWNPEQPTREDKLLVE